MERSAAHIVEPPYVVWKNKHSGNFLIFCIGKSGFATILCLKKATRMTPKCAPSDGFHRQNALCYLCGRLVWEDRPFDVGGYWERRKFSAAFELGRGARGMPEVLC